jgi:hypothetical protein
LVLKIAADRSKAEATIKQFENRKAKGARTFLPWIFAWGIVLFGCSCAYAQGQHYIVYAWGPSPTAGVCYNIHVGGTSEGEIAHWHVDECP